MRFGGFGAEWCWVRVDAVQPVLAPGVTRAGDGPGVAAGKVALDLEPAVVCLFLAHLDGLGMALCVSVFRSKPRPSPRISGLQCFD